MKRRIGKMAPIKKSIRGLILALMLSLGLFVFTSSKCLAIPYLQLDIAGGTYDAGTQTIIAPENHFTLYAYMTGLSLQKTYYISAALAPMTNDPNQGTFIFNSPYLSAYNGTAATNTVNFATDIYKDYGTPPHFDSDYNSISKYLPYDTGDLSQHGVFETIFKEFKVVFKSSSQISPYDTKSRALAGGDIQLGGSGMYYATFDVDTSDLKPGNAIHFDLYTLYENTGLSDLDVQYYAPFSYDAQSLDPPATQVPDASIMFLLGPGLVGLGLLGRRKFVK
jgi:hypothetical protein